MDYALRDYIEGRVKTDQRFLRGWSKQKIITALCKMHGSKQNLSYMEVRRDLPALVSAGEAYFGSWGKALHAAGIDPNLYFVHHKWRKPRKDTSMKER